MKVPQKHCFFSLQLKAKRNECNFKATHTRNEYLLTLAAANAHQRHYYQTDLISCIKVRTGRWTQPGGHVAWTERRVFMCVGVGWSDLQPGEGLFDVTLSDGAGRLPDR